MYDSTFFCKLSWFVFTALLATVINRRCNFRIIINFVLGKFAILAKMRRGADTFIVHKVKFVQITGPWLVVAQALIRAVQKFIGKYVAHYFAAVSVGVG